MQLDTKNIFAGLLEMRDAKGITNEQIAIQMGRTHVGAKNWISGILHGNDDCRISTFVKLCNALEKLGEMEIDYNELFKNYE
jgi:predicted transcriptional regulator